MFEDLSIYSFKQAATYEFEGREEKEGQIQTPFSSKRLHLIVIIYVLQAVIQASKFNNYTLFTSIL